MAETVLQYLKKKVQGFNEEKKALETLGNSFWAFPIAHYISDDGYVSPELILIKGNNKKEAMVNIVRYLRLREGISDIRSTIKGIYKYKWELSIPECDKEIAEGMGYPIWFGDSDAEESEEEGIIIGKPKFISMKAYLKQR